MTSPDAVLRMIRAHAQPLPRTGFVTAVSLNPQAVTVSMEDGSVTSSLAWNPAFTPAVGDRVLVTPTTTGWVVTSKVTAAPRLVPDEVVVVAPVNNWAKRNPWNFPGQPWFYQYDYASSSDPQYRGFVAQGRRPVSEGDPGQAQTRMEDSATVLYYGPLASRVPSGSTIQQVQLALNHGTSGGPDLAAPVMYGHTHTTANPPVGGAYTPLTPGQPPAWAPGFGPATFPPIARGEEAVLTVPPTFVTAWLAGTITGLGFYSDRVDQALSSWGPLDNAHLLITFTPPAA